MSRFCLSTNNYKNKSFPESHCFLVTAWKVVPIGIFQVFITRNWEVADLDSSLNNFFWFNSSKSWQVTSVLRCRMHCPKSGTGYSEMSSDPVDRVLLIYVAKKYTSCMSMLAIYRKGYKRIFGCNLWKRASFIQSVLNLLIRNEYS